MRKISRRTFLVETLQAAGVVALATLGGRPAWAKDETPAAATGTGLLTLNKLDTYPDGKVVIVTEARDGDGKPVKVQLGVLRQQDKVSVISTRCTHKGCTVKLRDDGSFRCPCHWARFDASGKVMRGPAKESLPWYAVKILENGELQVDPNKTVDPAVKP